MLNTATIEYNDLKERMAHAEKAILFLSIAVLCMSITIWKMN